MADETTEENSIITRSAIDNVDRRVEAMVNDLSDREAMVKATFIGADQVQTTNVQEAERGNNQHADIFHATGALEPPYSPEILCKLIEHSNALRQNVDAYAVNIDGNGHRFEPVIDLENDDDAFDQVRDAMFFELLNEADGDAEDVEFPSDDEVDAKIEEMIHEARLEKAKLDAFFRFCCIDESFISLRKNTRSDKEIMGNGYWEVLRDGNGDPAQFTYIPGFTMRLMPLGKEPPIEVEVMIKRTLFTFEKLKVKKRFRKFVQVFESRRVFFKEFGDPRVISAKTGSVFKTVDEMRGADGESADAVPATEIMHFPIHSPRSPYGIPRWIGTLLAVMGSRQSEEVNFLYFENKGVPPMAILISGGRLTADSTKKVEDHIKNKIKGRENFHSVMILEAEPVGNVALDSANARMKIEIVPLMDAQQKDALFQNYDEKNMDKVGMSFRLPRLLRGDIRDFNRATADAALEFAEMQVFSPEREDFDWTMNRKILTELEIKFWTFVSNAPVTRDPLDLAEIVTSMVKNSILTPGEARDLAKAIFNKDFKKIDELWTRIPPELLKAGILPEGEEGNFAGDGEGEEDPPEIDEDGDKKDGGKKDGETGADKRKRRRQEADKKREGSDGFTRIGSKKSKRIARRYNAKSRKEGIRKLARDLVDLRAMLHAEEMRSMKSDDTEQRTPENIEKEVIKVSAEDWANMIDVIDEREDGKPAK